MMDPSAPRRLASLLCLQDSDLEHWNASQLRHAQDESAFLSDGKDVITEVLRFHTGTRCGIVVEGRDARHLGSSGESGRGVWGRPWAAAFLATLPAAAPLVPEAGLARVG